MYCPKPHPLSILLSNALIVFVVFMVLDFIFYGMIWKGPLPYHSDLIEKLVYTFLFAVLFGHVYDRASHSWRPNSILAYIHPNKYVPDTELCKTSFSKILNGFVFSLIMSAIIILVMMMSKFVIAHIYIYMLDGIRSIPESTGDTAVLVGKVVAASTALESKGRTEDDPRMP